MTKLIGQHWLLLRGLCREAAHWGDFPNILQSRFPSATIHCLDLPGTGRFYQHTSPNRIEEIAAQLRRQAWDEGLLQQPVSLLALSLGGMVAWEWLRQYPEDIAATALVNTSFASLSPFYQRLRWQNYPAFSRILMQSNLYQRERAIIQLVSNHRQHDDELAKTWEKIQQQRPVSLANALRQISAAARYRPTAEKPQTPLLLLNGRGDRLVAPACSDAVHRAWQIEIDSHPWGGHDLILDDAHWVANRLQKWIARQPNQHE